MKTWRIATLMAVVACMWSASSAGSQTLGLYDDFNTGVLDPEKWLSYEYSINKSESRPSGLYGTPDWACASVPTLLSACPNDSGDPSNLVSMRRVVGGQAQIAVTAYRGFSGALYGQGAKARSGLRINHVALADHRPPVTAFRATVTVVRASVPTVPPEMSCYHSDIGTVRAELFGHFFNDGTSTGADDLTGDVFVLVGLARRVYATDGGEVVRNAVEAQMGRCNNPDCSRVRWGSTATFARRWMIGVPYLVSIVWQPASNAFVLTVDGGGGTESRTFAYAADEQTTVRGYAYDLRVETRPRRCYTEYGAPYQVPQEVSIDARFDDVQLNSTAATAAR